MRRVDVESACVDIRQSPKTDALVGYLLKGLSVTERNFRRQMTFERYQTWHRRTVFPYRHRSCPLRL